MNPIEQFAADTMGRVAALAEARDLHELSRKWILETSRYRYCYNFTWLGRPVIQYPQDIVAIQELIWRLKPDLIVETGIAHGGSLILSASMLALLDYTDAILQGAPFDPRSSKRRVLGVDIDIRAHNRDAILAHPLAHLVQMVEGSSIAPKVLGAVQSVAEQFRRILVILDSNHTADHVYAELRAYAPLVSRDSYCIVFDTVIEYMPDELYLDRPWKRGNSPMSAVNRFLADLARDPTPASDGRRLQFEIDADFDAKLLATVAPSGFLRRVD